MNEARRFSSTENQKIKMQDKQQQKYELVNKSLTYRQINTLRQCFLKNLKNYFSGEFSF